MGLIAIHWGLNPTKKLVSNWLKGGVVGDEGFEPPTPSV